MDEIGRLRKTETGGPDEKHRIGLPRGPAPCSAATAKALSVGLRTPAGQPTRRSAPSTTRAPAQAAEQARVGPVKGLPPCRSVIVSSTRGGTTVTVASSTSLTDRPRTSEPAAVAMFVMGEEPRVISAVSSVVWPTPSDGMSPMCPIVSSSTEMSNSVVSPVFVTA